MSRTIAIEDETVEMFETENDVTLVRRTALNMLMNQRLASAVDLQMQLKQAHWNVKGPNFHALHVLFDSAYANVTEYVDMIAERVVQFGGTANGSVRASAARTRLSEYPIGISEGTSHVEAVSRALATFGAEVRAMISEANDLEDAGTADLFTEVSRGIDKLLWFVEAHSQAKK